MPYLQAFTQRWSTDTHTTAYTVLDLDAWPRFTTEVLAYETFTKNTFMVLALVDLDTVPHEPWESLAARKQAFDLICALLPNAAVYTTKRGLRLVWALKNPVPLPLAGSWLEQWLQYLEPILEGFPGFELDLACKDIWRSFRLPFVTRDGTPTEPLTRLEPLAGPGLDWTPPAPLVRADEVSRSTTVRTHMPDEIPPPAPLEMWAHIVCSSKLTKDIKKALVAGEPFAEKGERNTKVVSIINSLAAQYQRSDISEPPA
jgi:hypothetical protein